MPGAKLAAPQSSAWLLKSHGLWSDFSEAKAIQKTTTAGRNCGRRADACHEASVLRALEHPNIVRSLGAGSAGYVLMEYLDGPTLKQLFQSQKRRQAIARPCAATCRARHRRWRPCCKPA